MRVIPREVVRDAAFRGVHAPAAKRLCVDDFARRGTHERRACEEDVALFLHDNILVCHGGHVRAAGDGHAVYDGNLRDTEGGHLSLEEGQNVC